MLASLRNSPHPKVILFLGSNIGNLHDDLAAKFIYQLGGNLKPGDKFIVIASDGVWDVMNSNEVVEPNTKLSCANNLLHSLFKSMKVCSGIYFMS